ncbi:hypothetical protein NST54_13490 [Caldifermentibacillus hisashii]|uniref:hypothetical protein n=1 Tax=Bacillaceae TaxID=186817 RepID=UPI000539FDF5|nr:hypothetical protein [Bacillus andreraoultii]
MDEWPQLLTKILADFEQRQYIPHTYIEIVIEEKRYDKLLEYCKRHIYYIESYYQYLINDYYEETKELFRMYIEKIACQASNRSQYRKVCHIIQTYKNNFGKNQAQSLINELKQENKRRPAFIDELSKIKVG